MSSQSLLSQLPPPPDGRTGWPWTEETPPTAAGANAPRITIVTPSFNQAQWLEETIRSVLLQNYPNLEYFVMDGGSTDDSAAIIQKYEPWLAGWVSEKDRGQSHAINKGFERATGDLYAYINSDDYYLPGAFASAARGIGDPAKPALLHGICCIVNEDGELVREHLGRISSFDEIVDLWKVWWSRRQFVQPEVFWTAKAHRLAGPFREDLNFGMDYDFFCRVLAHRARVYTVEEAVACFRLSPSQKSSQAARAAEELRCVVERFLRHSSPPIKAGRRRELQRRLTYDRTFHAAIRQSREAQEGRAARWGRLAAVVARHPSLLLAHPFWSHIVGALRR